MSKTGVILGSAAMALSLFVSYPALSQDIDFGDDSGNWANDGECDDPRFGGTIDSHRLADATDCRTAYEAGELVYDASVIISGAVQPSSEIDFGDDSGQYANDGECDDPRFGGLLESHALADAADCLAAYEGGHVEYIGLAISSGASIDFGEDTGSFANDGECDDPRFGGTLTSHEYADATDCRAAYEADPSIYIGDGGAAAGDTSAYIGSIDFGDNSSDYADNNICDDPRFTGPGSAGTLLFADRMADANDCEALFAQGQISFNGVNGDPALAGVAEIDFGDDTSDYANNDKCDDPRFAGPGTDSILLHMDLGHDATDCLALFESGSVHLAGVGDTGNTGNGVQSTGSFRIDFGDNSSDYADNNICDDPRFTGPGSASVMLFTGRMADANDCEALFAQGQISFNGVSGDPAQAGVAEIDFGDDTSSYANNDTCDDPRFAGPGTDSILLHGDLGHDATDCLMLFESGEVYLAGVGGRGDTGVADTGSAVQPTGNFRINFGDDTGDYPHDGQCDDPRFQGRGAAMELYDDNILGDATDCRAAHEAGTVTYAP